MPTDDRALREKLDALAEDKERELGFLIGLPGCFREVALDLLREKEQRETPCVWSVDDDGIWTATCGEVEWCFNDGGPVENKVMRCCGCGHPVQVNQPQDAAEEK